MRARRRRSGRALVTTGLLALAVLASGCGLSFQALPKPGGVDGPTYSLTAVFANVLNLPVQARVLIGADQVGEVSGISTSHFKADLTLTIRQSIRIPRGTTAQILFVNPLGDEFIQLHPPTRAPHGYLHNGDTVGQQETSSAPSIADTLAALGALLNGGGLNQLQTIIQNINQALGGHQQQLRQIIGGISYDVTAIDNNKGAVDNALVGLAALSGELAKSDGVIANGIDTIGPAVAVLSSENSDFSNLLTATNQLADVADSIVSQSSNSIVGTIDQLYAVVNQMVGVESQLGPTLTDLTAFEKATPKIAPGAYLQLSLDGTAIVHQSPYFGTKDPGTPSASSSNTSRSIDGLLGGGLP